MHDFVKAAGLKSEKEFYDLYKTPEDFFSAHPHMKNGGYSGTYSGGVYFANGGNYSQNGGAFTGMENGTAPVFGIGGGAMSYDMEEMKRGGKPKHKLTPAQKQKLMQYMALQQQMQQQPGGQPQQVPMMPPGQQYAPQQQMDPQQMQMMQQQQMQGQPQMQDPNQQQMGKGGIHIKPSHKGRFTAYKERTGKTTEEALHSPDPHVRQMANFARNAKHFNHEYGGTANPFHPLARYFQEGGDSEGNQQVDQYQPPNDRQPPVTNDTPPGMEGSQMTMVPNASQNASTAGAFQPNQSNYNTSTGITDPYTQPAPDEGEGDGSQQTTDNTNGNGSGGNRKQPRQWNGLRATGSLINSGIGIMTGLNAYSNYHNNQRDKLSGYNDNIEAQRNRHYNEPGSQGDYDYAGALRPNMNTPTNAGVFYGKFGGNYKQGDEVELEDAEINRLKSLGYKFQYV